MLDRTRTTCRLIQDRGASAVEYGLMVAAIAAVTVGIVFALGNMIESVFTKTCSAVASGAELEVDPSCGGPPAQP